jgi:hypothetical protein
MPFSRSSEGSDILVPAPQARAPSLLEPLNEKGQIIGGLLQIVTTRDENGTEIFRIDRFRFLYYEPFFNIKNYQF